MKKTLSSFGFNTILHFLSKLTQLIQSTSKKGCNLVINSYFVVIAKQWHNKLQPREKLLVNLAGILLTIYFIYLVVLSPVFHLVSAVEQDFAIAEDNLLWLQNQAGIVKSYRAQGVINLSQQQLINRSRAVFRRHGIDVKLNATKRDQDFLITLEYAGNRPSSFFAALNKITKLGILVRKLDLTRVDTGQVSITASLVY